MSKKLLIKAHKDYPEYIIITQVDDYFATIDEVHFKKSEIPEIIKKLEELSNA